MTASENNCEEKCWEDTDQVAKQLVDKVLEGGASAGLSHVLGAGHAALIQNAQHWRAPSRSRCR